MDCQVDGRPNCPELLLLWTSEVFLNELHIPRNAGGSFKGNLLSAYFSSYKFVTSCNETRFDSASIIHPLSSVWRPFPWSCFVFAFHIVAHLILSCLPTYMLFLSWFPPNWVLHFVYLMVSIFAVSYTYLILMSCSSYTYNVLCYYIKYWMIYYFIFHFVSPQF